MGGAAGQAGEGLVVGVQCVREFENAGCAGQRGCRRRWEAPRWDMPPPPGRAGTQGLRA